MTIKQRRKEELLKKLHTIACPNCRQKTLDLIDEVFHCETCKHKADVIVTRAASY